MLRKPRTTALNHTSGRALLRHAVLALLLVLLPVAIGIGNAVSKVRQLVVYDRPSLVVPLPEPPAPDPLKRTAVVLMSNNRTEITDLLPYVLSYSWTDRNRKPVANQGGRSTNQWPPSVPLLQ